MVIQWQVLQVLHLFEVAGRKWVIIQYQFSTAYLLKVKTILQPSPLLQVRLCIHSSISAHTDRCFRLLLTTYSRVCSVTHQLFRRIRALQGQKHQQLKRCRRMSHLSLQTQCCSFLLREKRAAKSQGSRWTRFYGIPPWASLFYLCENITPKSRWVPI